MGRDLTVVLEGKGLAVTLAGRTLRLNRPDGENETIPLAMIWRACDRLLRAVVKTWEQEERDG